MWEGVRVRRRHALRFERRIGASTPIKVTPLAPLCDDTQSKDPGLCIVYVDNRVWERAQTGIFALSVITELRRPSSRPYIWQRGLRLDLANLSSVFKTYAVLSTIVFCRNAGHCSLKVQISEQCTMKCFKVVFISSPFQFSVYVFFLDFKSKILFCQTLLLICEAVLNKNVIVQRQRLY